ncbi:MAG: ribbon-helix-helix protein, CopG family [Actinomycetota bacterium]|nr:ribbon-helix-helix protein, CopG family [Actinomycetota bacterium]MDQ3720609.1 ribbon-helix-helix protein, CopG family [Actinomycetota bacterium]
MRASSIHVRLDPSSARALAALRRREGVTGSEAVRLALRESAERRRRLSAIAAEVETLAGDREDLAEAAAVRELMDDLAPER